MQDGQLYCVYVCVCVRVFGNLLISSSPCQPYLCKMDNQPPPQQAVAMVMDNRGCSHSGNTNTLTSGGNYPGNWLMCPITFLLLSSIVPLWCVGGDGAYGEEEMGYGEEEMVWGGGDEVRRRR